MRLWLISFASAFLMTAGIACAQDAGSSTDANGNSNQEGATASSNDPIGVPECDDYIAQYNKCIEKVPDNEKATFKASSQKIRDSYKNLAGNDPRTPQNQDFLAAVCAQSAAQMKQKMGEQYGCQ